MKTIATAAVFLDLTATAWADEPQNTQTNDPANTTEPIVLSEAEMDGVTAGVFRQYTGTNFRLYYSTDASSTSGTSRLFRFELDMISDNNAGAS